MLSERLRERRRINGATQANIANVLGVSPKTVSHWETGEREPDLATLKRLAEALGTSIAYLAGETNDPRPITPVGHMSEHSDTTYHPSSLAPEHLQELESVFLKIERRRQKERKEKK